MQMGTKKIRNHCVMAYVIITSLQRNFASWVVVGIVNILIMFFIKTYVSQEEQ